MPEDFAPDGFESLEGAAALIVDVEGFEGPLDLLLTLARAQKIDLRKVSALQLAEAYLGFVSAAHRLRIELAAEYLVMAAWLAFLKSRLLLPPPHEDGGPTGEEMAEALAARLAHLERIREAGAALMARDQLGRDVFARGEVEPMRTGETRTEWAASLSDLLQAYASIRTREAYQPLHLTRPAALALEEAFARLEKMLGVSTGWTDLQALLPKEWLGDAARRRSAAASTFLAALEMARRGEAELRQESHFAPLMLRRTAA